MNEWDACATEEAIQIRERLGEGEVVVVTAGDDDADAALRRCLAMGADRAVRVDAQPLDPISTARALAGVVAAESPDLVLTGVQSADSVQGSTGAALAELVGLPRVAVVTKVDWNGSGPATVDRELEGGLVDVVEVDTPALLTVQTGINQPRYANLRAIKQAEQHEIAVVSADPGRSPKSDTTGGSGLEHAPSTRPEPPGEPAYSVRRMFTPPRGEGAEMLDGGPAQVAQRIVELVQERLA